MLKQIKTIFLITLVSFFVACGGGTSSSDTDEVIEKARGKWNPIFGGEQFLIEETKDDDGNVIYREATLYEEKLEDDAITVDTEATNLTYVFNSLGKFEIDITNSSEFDLGITIEGKYDIDYNSTKLILNNVTANGTNIEVYDAVYELFENKENNCFKVRKIVSGKSDSYYNLCYKLN